MITYHEAYTIVLKHSMDFGRVQVPLDKADDRILAEDILADRDFPPFDRATKDGIAIALEGDKQPLDYYNVQGIAAAGASQLTLVDPSHCLEVMTGAIMPKNANTVVMYEHIALKEGQAYINQSVTSGQNVHAKGSDEPRGSVLLSKGQRVSAAEVGILAAVGKSSVLVQKNPKVGLFSTGDELVPIDAVPKVHQIRRSNAHTLKAALGQEGIGADMLHIQDDKQTIHKALDKAMTMYDVLILSGGVSKGKYDFLPEVLEELGVQKHFHRVQQRPGKPFWFGTDPKTGTIIFGFPGNPTSTFANYHLYFRPWLNTCFGQPSSEVDVFLTDDFENTTDLTRFIRAYAFVEKGRLYARLVHGNGSGDLTSLTMANGFVRVGPKKKLNKNKSAVFVPTRKILW